MFRKPNQQMLEELCAIIDDTTALAPELSKRGIKYSHSELLNLVGQLYVASAVREMKREFEVMNHTRRLQMNPLSMLNPTQGTAMEKDED